MWNKVFNVKNPFWQSMDTVFNLFVLNLYWVICCIPVITIGPATAAMYYTLIERMQGTGGYLHVDFFHSFKKNLKQGILLGVPATLVGAFLAWDMWLCYHSGRGIYSFFLFFFAVLMIFWAFTILYLFPLLGKFERTNKQLVIWAFTLSIKNIPMTLLMWVVIIISLWFCKFFPGLLFIIFGILSQFCATIMASIFKPYMTQETEDDGTEGREPGTKTKDYMEYDNIQDLL